MTSNTDLRVGVIGTGLIGTSVALAARRIGCSVRGWDHDRERTRRASGLGGLEEAGDLEEAVERADIVVIATPIPTIPELVARALACAPDAVVTDVGSVKSPLVKATLDAVPHTDAVRYVPGHPMGGSERSGPDHASASLIDGIVWVLSPSGISDPAMVDRLEGWVRAMGAVSVRMDPERHDRLVAFVSHLPQVASTALMSVAATEEADEPELLLLAAGGFRDLTRLASSNPGLWSDILLSNRDAIADAIDRYVAQLERLRSQIAERRGTEVEATFAAAQSARLRMAAKPKVRAGVAVLQVELPDRPGALAHLTQALGDGEVNIEDLQISHSPEGGRGTVHLTVAAADAVSAAEALSAAGFDPIRLA
ncbi:MAG TPA: prephenate dehydrogenase [Actinomycetota bacterium]